jgi:2-polyprenyl-3-methyl-5-hydroxy-6-metoxy-1,4-benzoquinol methylase
LDLGSGPGAWVRRLHDASYAVTACDFTAPKEKFEFPYYQLDSNQNFATRFESEAFDAVCIVEVIEHLKIQGTLFGRLRYCSKRKESFF